jgi:hypothetical protein
MVSKDQEFFEYEYDAIELCREERMKLVQSQVLTKTHLYNGGCIYDLSCSNVSEVQLYLIFRHYLIISNSIQKNESHDCWLDKVHSQHLLQ